LYNLIIFFSNINIYGKVYKYLFLKNDMQINIEKRHFALIFAIIVFLAGVLIVIAVAPNPGHTLSQIEMPSCQTGQALVKTSTGWGCGTGAGSALGTQDCYMIKPDRWTSAICGDGFYAKAIYKYTDDNWDGYGLMCCRADASTNDPNLPDAKTLASQCPWGWGGIYCSLQVTTSPTNTGLPKKLKCASQTEESACLAIYNSTGSNLFKAPQLCLTSPCPTVGYTVDHCEICGGTTTSFPRYYYWKQVCVKSPFDTACEANPSCGTANIAQIIPYC